MLAAGLLVDAFIVRSLLAPALVSLFGDLSAWPGRALGPRGGDESGRTDDPDTLGTGAAPRASGT